MVNYKLLTYQFCGKMNIQRESGLKFTVLLLLNQKTINEIQGNPFHMQERGRREQQIELI